MTDALDGPNRVRAAAYALAGALAGAAVGVVLCFGAALLFMTLAGPPQDTPPDFCIPVGLGAGIPIGALAAVHLAFRGQRSS